ncbi:MAG: hypothetical protein PVH63_03735 [Balneolaceae bacterium]
MVLLLGAEIAAGCSNQVSGSNPNSVPDNWYGHNVQTIFNQHCGGNGGCHINGNANGVNLSTYKNVVNGFSNEYKKNLVDPGSAANSPLYDKLLSPPKYGYRMPYGRSPLSSAMMDTIKVWINRGAKNQ